MGVNTSTSDEGNEYAKSLFERKTHTYTHTGRALVRIHKCTIATPSSSKKTHGCGVA